MQAIESGAYDVCVVYDLSRFFGRTTRWLAQLREDVILPTNTAFISIFEKIDLETDEGWTAALAICMAGEMQRQNEHPSHRDAAAMRCESGFIHGRVGYGWQWRSLADLEPRQRRGIKPVPEKAQWVKHSAERFLSGWGLGKIAREFEELGVESPTGLPQWCLPLCDKCYVIPRTPAWCG